jgi:hypothetical protein
MSRKFGNETELVEAIRDLPGAMEPRRDLWPGIAARLGRRSGASSRSPARSGWRWQALAASIAVAFAAGVLFDRQLGREAPSAGQQPGPDIAMVAALRASEREYHAAFRQFISVGEARPMLEPQAVQNIENSWFDMQQAESVLLAALREYPANTFLKERLLELRAQQLGFMQQLAMLDQFSRRRT